MSKTLDATTKVMDEEIKEIVVVDKSGKLSVPKAVADHLTLIEKTKKEFEAYEKEVRTALKEAMEEHGVTKIELDNLLINYIDETERTTIDSRTLQANYPKIYNEVAKKSKVKSTVRIKVV